MYPIYALRYMCSALMYPKLGRLTTRFADWYPYVPELALGRSTGGFLCCWGNCGMLVICRLW